MACCFCVILVASMLALSYGAIPTEACTSTSCLRPAAATARLQSKYYDMSTGGWGCGWKANTPDKRLPWEDSASFAHADGSLSAGTLDSIGWWNCANSLEALSNFIIYSGDHSYDSVVENTWDKTAIPFPFLCSLYTSNDDRGWWSLAWIRAYEATGHIKYLSRSACYFNAVSLYWDDTCGGGVWWSGKKTYKNAITNELFLIQALKLYRYTGNQTYMQWAQREWKWFEQSGMINSQYLINDGLANCKNNHGTTWTYNQGVLLGGLAELALLTHNDTLIDLALTLANATMHLLVYPNGILKESCESEPGNDCNNDQDQFKGVWARYAGYLVHNISSVPKFANDTRTAAIKSFIRANAQSIWIHDRSATNDFGLRWEGPFSNTTATSATLQTSALDCLNTNLLFTSMDAMLG